MSMKTQKNDLQELAAIYENVAYPKPMSPGELTKYTNLLVNSKDQRDIEKYTNIIMNGFYAGSNNA